MTNMEDESSDCSDNTILYELLIYSEWPQDPEIQGKGPFDDKLHFGSSWKWLTTPLNQNTCPPLKIQHIKNHQMPWQYAMGREGRVIAVLQELFMEIRSSRDEYGSVLGRVVVPKDPFPQWRKVTWSPDCLLLVLGHSNGNVDVFDLIGAPLFTIVNIETQEKATEELGEAIVGMVFCDMRTKNTQWSYELLVANYKGTIRSYFVSPTGYQDSHEFSVSSHYPYGITTFLYLQSSQLLVMSGQTTRFPSTESPHSALDFGVTVWRILSGQPFYKLALSLDDEKSLQKTFWWQAFPQYWKIGITTSQDIIYNMCISPNNDILAAIHVSGTLSLWELPSLRLKSSWQLTLQPNYSDINPQYCEPGMKRKTPEIMAYEYRCHPNDVNWWSNDALILGRACGAVTVSSTESLKNLLGVSPEWFEPFVQISASHDRGFLALECEKFITSKKRSSSELCDVDESSDDEDVSYFTRAAEMTKKAMFYVTDNDRFRPPRKKTRFVNKTYRLLCLKSTTPEELFSRKINNEEYGEALALAKTYNMDCDLVYQRQWRKTPASVATIQDYLSKITKRAWVLHECLERVPETLDAAKELLMYGLRGTDLQVLITVGKGEDHGRFITYQDCDDEFVDEYEDFTTTQKAEEKKADRERKQHELLKQIDFSRLSLEQKQLCECRLKLLLYLDRLSTYEAILGGPGIAEDFYDQNFFRNFRSQSGLEACIDFAHDSNWQAIAAMFTYHGNETLQHYLVVLSNFPETTSPIEYQLLLPKLGYSEKGPIVCPWNEDQWRVADWCETQYESAISSPVSNDFVVDFYDDNKEYLKFRGNIISKILTAWYLERAHEIESRSCLVDNALDLLKLGMERNVQGLENLLDNLKTLEMLTYECQLERDVSLKQLEELSCFEIVQLLMSKSDDKTFIPHVKSWLLPYLNCCEKEKPGSQLDLLRRYLIYVSKENLNFCRKVIENSRREHMDSILINIEDQMSFALDCIYKCESVDCLKDVCIILEHLPSQNTSIVTPKLKKLYSEIAELETHVRIAEIVKKNGSSMSLGFIKNCSVNEEETQKLLTKITRVAGRKYPPLSEANWISLLTDILEIQKLWSGIIKVQQCCEIFLLSLLCNGVKDTICLAGKLMVCSKQKRVKVHSELGHLTYKLPYEASVNLVLKASQEYVNSSANLADPCMTLARYCLSLVEDSCPALEEEEDLISSLELLQEFNVTILPLQVRLCTERLTFVEQAMKNKSNAYRTPQKLLKLAYLLRVCGDNKKDRDGKVLSLIADVAFKEKDYESSLNACCQLMEGEHERGWMICYELGKCKEFNNHSARCELMSFALVHCNDDLLEDILKTKLELELQIICERVKFLMGDESPSETSEISMPEIPKDISSSNGSNPLWQTGEKTLQVLQNTSKTTKSVFTSVKNTRFWKDAVKWIKPDELPWEDNASGERTRNKDLNMQGVCAFYSGLFENPHINEFVADYQKYATPNWSQPLEISSKLFRASLLEDSIKNEVLKSGLNTAVVLDLAKAFIAEDMLYAMALLLGLQHIEDAEQLFQKLPNTPIVLQFASLFYAIHIRSHFKDFQPSHLKDDNCQDPSEIIRNVEDYMNSDAAQQLYKDDEIVQKAFECMKKYNKILYDFIQAELLHSIGGGVDAVRFASDDVYKKETILGIAMTQNDRVFQIAVSLAHHYNLPRWDVYIAQLEYLFSENRLSLSSINSRIESLKLLDTLLTQPKKFHDKLSSSVYRYIDGKDNGKLVRYFSLLELCGDKPDSLGHTPSAHIKLLNKLRSIKGIDYKFLMSGNTSLLSYLIPFINESNVHIIAKMASMIPDGNGSFLKPSTIYNLWVTKYFFYGKSTACKDPKSSIDWLHRYDSCKDMLQRLVYNDFQKFIDNIVFSVEALEKYSIECRAEIIKKAMKFCRSKDYKEKDRLGTQADWKKLLEELQQYQKHLSRMEDPILVELRDSTNPKTKVLLEEFDLTKSAVLELKQFFVKVVIVGSEISLLKTFLSCCPSEWNWGPADAYLEAIHFLIKRMRGNMTEFPNLECNTPIDALEHVLHEVSINRDDLMIDDIAIDAVYDFCQDSSIEITMRLKVLHLLEKTSYFTEEYSNLLLLYQTQAVVSSIWLKYEVNEDDVKNETARKELFSKLVPSCSTVEHFCSLAELLCHWPVFSPEIGIENWTLVLGHLASLPDMRGVEKVLLFFEKANSETTFTQECCWKIYREISKHRSIPHCLKFVFGTTYEDLHAAAITMFKEEAMVDKAEYDEEIVRLILEHHLTVHVVSTNLYKPVIEYLFSHQEQFSVQSVIEELKDAGHLSEAGSLMLISTKTHPALRTFSSAFRILKGMLPNT